MIYFHAVVTVPEERRGRFYRNQKLDVWPADVQVSAAAIKDLCADKRHLGALPGMLSVLPPPGMAAWTITPTCTC